MTNHSATIYRIEDEHGVRCVVKDADPIIWIADELLDEAAPPGQSPIAGGLERDAHFVTFGVPDEGLGHLTYEIVRHDAERQCHIAQRVATHRRGVTERGEA